MKRTRNQRDGVRNIEAFAVKRNETAENVLSKWLENDEQNVKIRATIHNWPELIVKLYGSSGFKKRTECFR